MGRACPHCLGTGLAPEPAAVDPAAVEAQLLATCRERAIWRSHDGLVREDAAAELIELKAKTLRNRRYADAAIPHVMRTGRAHYRLSDLAQHLASHAK